MDDAIRDCELDVTAGKGHAVDTLGVGMIVRTGIQRKNLHEDNLPSQNSAAPLLPERLYSLLFRLRIH